MEAKTALQRVHLHAGYAGRASGNSCVRWGVNHQATFCTLQLGSVRTGHLHWAMHSSHSCWMRVVARQHYHAFNMAETVFVHLQHASRC